jgi:chromosomal replication initiation ATPase DnaA
MTGPAQPRQLALSLGHAASHAREDFLAGPSNAGGLALVESWPDWPARQVVLAGPEGSGKSHLAAIWAAHAGASVLPAQALGEADLPAALQSGAMVLEDLTAGEFDERSLFHLLNLAREEEAALLVTARSAPAGWTVAIRDLASRLKALPVVVLSPPDDLILRGVLIKLFADRQIAVDEALITYLSTHIERSFKAARAIVDLLDREAISRKRPVTRTLAAEILRRP